MMSLLLAFSTKSYSPAPVFLSALLPAMSDRRICYPRSVDSESTPPVDALARIQAPNYEPYDVSMPDDKRPRASLATAAAGALPSRTDRAKNDALARTAAATGPRARHRSPRTHR